MQDTIYQAIINQMDWIEQDFIEFQTEHKKAIARSKTLKSISRYIQTPKGANKEKAKYICQGNLQICKALGYFNESETNFFLNFLERYA